MICNGDLRSDKKNCYLLLLIIKAFTDSEYRIWQIFQERMLL